MLTLNSSAPELKIVRRSTLPPYASTLKEVTPESLAFLQAVAKAVFAAIDHSHIVMCPVADAETPCRTIARPRGWGRLKNLVNLPQHLTVIGNR